MCAPKNLITMMCAGLLSIGVSAQTTSQGSMLVGTTSNLSHSTLTPDGEDGESVLFLNGQYGYFFADNICGGLGLNYMSVDGESSTGFGLFGRYYFMEGEMYGHIGYDMGDYLLYGFFPVEDYSGINLGAGYCVWLGDNITLEPSLLYTMMKAEGETLGTNLDVRVGFGVYF